MMKLIISLAALIAISNGASCELNTALSDTCGSLTISGVNNADIDGQYNRIDDSLFQKIDGSANYLSYWNGNYVGLEAGDVRCQSNSGSYRVKFDASILDDLIVGDAETFNPTFPSSRTVTISCDTASTQRATPAPVTPVAPVEGLGSICLSTSYTGSLTSPINIKFSRLAGQYVEIPGGLNGKPAYELVNSGSACSASVTLMYVGQIGNVIWNRYFFARNRNDPTNNYYFACDNSEEIGNNDLSAGTCEGGLQSIMSLSQGSNCVCGRS